MRNSFGWVGTSVGLFGVAKLFNAGRTGAAVGLVALLALGPVPLFFAICFLIIGIAKIFWWLVAAVSFLACVALFQWVRKLSEPPPLPRYFKMGGYWWKSVPIGEPVRVPPELIARYTTEQRQQMQDNFFKLCPHLLPKDDMS